MCPLSEKKCRKVEKQACGGQGGGQVCPMHGSPTGSGKECLEVRDVNVGVMGIQTETNNMQRDSFPRSKVRGSQWSHLLLQSPLTLPLKSLCILPGFIWFFSYPIPSPIVLTSSKTPAASLVSYTYKWARPPMWKWVKCNSFLSRSNSILQDPSHHCLPFGPCP